MERISDTLFFKHKYLTLPVTSASNYIVATTEQLMVSAAGIPKGELKEMQDLKAFAESFEKIVSRNKEDMDKLKVKHNRITYIP